MLNTIAFRDGFYYKPRIDYKTLEQYHEGLVCLSACLAGDVPKLILEEQFEKAEELILWFKNLFGEDYYLEIQHNGIIEQEIVNNKLREYSKKFNIKLVATNDVHYLMQDDAEMQDVLMCVSMQKFVDDPDRMKFSTDEFYVKTEEEFPYRLLVKGDVDGYEPDGSPSYGSFMYELELSDAMTGQVTLPRQRDESLFLEIWDKGSVLKVFTLGRYISATGYDWSAEDLEDLTLSLDYTHNLIGITIGDWDKEHHFDISI